MTTAKKTTTKAPPEPANINEALVRFHELSTPVPKGSVNPHFRSSYADLAAVVSHIKPSLNACGLAFVQTVERDELDTWVKTTVLHKSGEKYESIVPYILPDRGSGPQAHGSAQTYARRYGLMCALGVAAVDDDDDGNAGQAQTTARKPASAHPGSDPRSVRKLKARYEQTCPICNSPIQIDAPIAWRKDNEGTARVAHWACYEAALKAKDSAVDEGPHDDPDESFEASIHDHDPENVDYTQIPYPGDDDEPTKQ